MGEDMRQIRQVRGQGGSKPLQGKKNRNGERRRNGEAGKGE